MFLTHLSLKKGTRIVYKVRKNKEIQKKKIKL